MGLNYSIDLYFPIDNVEKVLMATIAIAEVVPDAQTQIKLPSGNTITVPFTTNFRNGASIDLTIDNEFALDTALLFIEDAAIREYYEGNNHRATGYGDVLDCPIGYIYLHITCDKQYVCFSFTAAVSSMSLLFVKSASIQNRFLEILNTNGGVIGLIDVEDWDYLLLENPALRISDDTNVINCYTSYLSIDAFVTRILEVKVYQRTRWQELGDPVAFYAKWVNCFNHYLSPWRFIDELRTEEQLKLKTLFVEHNAKITDNILRNLLAEHNWLPRCIGGLFIAINQRQDYTETIGALLLQHPHNSPALCLALAHLNNEKAVRYLVQYLEQYLVLENTNPNEREDLIVDWVLAALAFVDTKSGTEIAKKYLAPNGLWATFVEHGQPDELLNDLKYWLDRWDFEKTKSRFQSGIDFLEGFFDQNTSSMV
ncbi:MAG TPA: DUF6000 family protein [Phototrophicaceae bacterium]|nr:DUF6000 family protein [Phototrophicaceae bacterium]